MTDKSRSAEIFIKLVKALHLLREVRDNKTLLPLTDDQMNLLTSLTRQIDDIVEHIELTGFEEKHLKEIIGIGQI
jgi:hypothetical protein